MKWNRSVLCVLAVGATAVLVLTGCSSSGTTGASTGATTSAKAGAVKIAFVPGVIGDEFYVTMQCGIQEAAKAGGATVGMQGPQKFNQRSRSRSSMPSWLQSRTH